MNVNAGSQTEYAQISNNELKCINSFIQLKYDTLQTRFILCGPNSLIEITRIKSDIVVDEIWAGSAFQEKVKTFHNNCA